MVISSKGNQIVKNLVLLRDRGRARREQGLFAAEGLRMFREVPSGWLRDVYVTERFLAEHEALVREKANGCRVTVLSDAVFSHVSDTKTPQGVLCVLAMPEAVIPRDGAPLVLILEGIQDPGNLGTLFRSAEGAGAAGVLMDTSCADIFSPKSVRATMGSIFRVPFQVSQDLPGDIARMKQDGIQICAAYLSGSICYDVPDYTKGTAILIGNEGSGLKQETAVLADQCIRIPMEGQLESLNAAVSGSILLYEANRQRRSIKADEIDKL